MAKVTSKLQLTLPKAVADEYGIAPGDQVDFVPAGDAIRLVPVRGQRETGDRAERLRSFDAATARQQRRQAHRRAHAGPDRGWTREQLYDRGRAR